MNKKYDIAVVLNYALFIILSIILVSKEDFTILLLTGFIFGVISKIIHRIFNINSVFDEITKKLINGDDLFGFIFGLVISGLLGIIQAVVLIPELIFCIKNLFSK